jgi:hypothetical protein
MFGASALMAALVPASLGVDIERLRPVIVIAVVQRSR